MNERKDLGQHVVVICGLPGSGKSTVARLLHKRLDWKLLTTERIRANLFPSVQFDHGDADFTQGELNKTYSKLHVSLADTLNRGTSAIVDGVFRHQSQRDLVQEVAIDNGIIPSWVLLQCDSIEAIRRLEIRTGGATAGPAGPLAYEKIASEFEMWPQYMHAIDTTEQSPQSVADDIERFLSLGEGAS
jgi:predicted kinase